MSGRWLTRGRCSRRVALPAPNVRWRRRPGRLAAIGSRYARGQRRCSRPDGRVLAAGGDDVGWHRGVVGARAQLRRPVALKRRCFTFGLYQILQGGAAAYAMAEDRQRTASFGGVVSRAHKDRTGGDVAGARTSRSAGGFGGVGQAGGRAAADRSATSESAAQHGTGSAKRWRRRPEWLAPRTAAAAFLLRTAAAQQVPIVADPGGSGGVGSAAGSGTEAGSADAVSARWRVYIVGSVRGDGGVGMASGDAV